MQRLKIDALKFKGAKRFKSKDGVEHVAIPLEANNVYIGEKGLYLELSIMENRDGPGQYGDDGFASLDIGKVRREAGEKGPILGNWKHVGERQPLGARSPEYGQRDSHQNGAPPPSQTATADSLDEEDDLPF